MEWNFVYWYGYTFWVYEFNGLARTWAVILMISGLNSKSLNSQLAPVLNDKLARNPCVLFRREVCNLGAHSLDLACWHALFGPHSLAHTVFLKQLIYMPRNLQKKLLFLPFFEKIWQHWAHIPMWQQFAAVCLRWGRCISVFYGFITFYNNYFHYSLI